MTLDPQVLRMLDDPSGHSRNRNFADFERPSMRRAARVARLLRGLRDDLRSDPQCEGAFARAESSSSGVRVRVVLPRIHGNRTSFLSQEEFAWLVLDPRVRQTLGL